MAPTFTSFTQLAGLTYAGVPFCLDQANVVRMPYPAGNGPGPAGPDPIKRQQPMADIVDELNRLLPFQYLQDFSLTPSDPGYTLQKLARRNSLGPMPNPTVKIGDWYYPNTASRWSVFRGLATTSQVEAMFAATQGVSPAVFTMQTAPFGIDPQLIDNYALASYMYMLPPRPLAEHGTQYDGLYLVTLVDERYYWMYNPISLTVKSTTSWPDLISQIAVILNIDIVTGTVASDVYGRPEPDSQLWCNLEPAGFLLDVCAYNIGYTAVRNLDGSYSLLTAQQSKDLMELNRGADPTIVVRTAGGDLFGERAQDAVGAQIMGSGTIAPNAVIPPLIKVSFPKYVVGDDPVPHFLNTRTGNQRQSAWYEESFGQTFVVDVPITSGGNSVSGLTGNIQSFSTNILTQNTRQFATSGWETNSGYLQRLAVNTGSGIEIDVVVDSVNVIVEGILTIDPGGKPADGFRVNIWLSYQSGGKTYKNFATVTTASKNATSGVIISGKYVSGSFSFVLEGEYKATFQVPSDAIHLDAKAQCADFPSSPWYGSEQTAASAPTTILMPTFSVVAN